MNGMSEEERKQYDEAMMQCQKEENYQYDKDQTLLERIKECVSPEYFKDIEFKLEESEHPSNYRIVDTPVGEPHHNEEGNYPIWINQSCGETGDNYSGTVCMKLPIGKYLMWDYWM